MYQRLCKYKRIIHFTYEFIIILLVSTPMLALLGHNSQHVVAGIIFVVLQLSNIILVIAQFNLTHATHSKLKFLATWKLYLERPNFCKFIMKVSTFFETRKPRGGVFHAVTRACEMLYSD